MNKITILFNGYSHMLENDPRGDIMRANCTCTLIQCHTGENIIIDTMDAWSGKSILKALQDHKVSPDNIQFCISSHTHPDHMGNNNLFLNARHIVGHTVSERDEYFIHDFEKEPYVINKDVEVHATKGHTLTCVSVICRNAEIDGKIGKTVGIVGDLFENGNDVERPELWKEAGSEAMDDQILNRYEISKQVDYIIPGHGPIFEITDDIREKLRQQVVNLV